jgi:hypothetical protein
MGNTCSMPGSDGICLKNLSVNLKGIDHLGCLCLTSHQAMRMCREVDGGDWSASHPSRFIHGKESLHPLDRRLPRYG